MSIRLRNLGRFFGIVCLSALLLTILTPTWAYCQEAEAAPEKATSAEATSAEAAPEEPKPEPPAPDVAMKTDDDFPLQGEYVGTVMLRPSRPRTLVLQIRAGGQGTFEAAEHLGGFPTRVNPRKDPTRLAGTRTRDFAVLSGGDWVVLVHPDYCVLVNPEGERVGRLERIHRESPTLGAKPPKHAMVLFDGTNTDHFTNGRMTAEGLLMEGSDFKPMFQDFNLHLEFMLPYMPEARGQGRANSGLYLQSRYECQVLDSFAIPPGNNGSGALYRFREPDLNMCLPPLAWQTYDIKFTAPRWASDGTKTRNARITVWLNGVKVQDDVELPNKTGAGQIEEPVLKPIRLQNHGNPIRFRNIWVIDRGLAPAGRFPVRAEVEEKEAE